MPHFKMKPVGLWFLSLLISVSSLAEETSSFILEQERFIPFATSDTEYKTNWYDLHVYQQQEKVYQDNIAELESALEAIDALSQKDTDFSETSTDLQQQIEQDQEALQAIQVSIEQAKTYLQTHQQVAEEVLWSESLRLQLVRVYEQKIKQLMQASQPFEEQLDWLYARLYALSNQPSSKIDYVLYHELSRRVSEIYRQYKPITEQLADLNLKLHNLKNTLLADA
tara:strand:- start:3144 stop:3818 length:675 start_codon:yes stop_codon:yes gene_type:complete